MQLDQNRIVIRERGYLDILDLALRVIRAYVGPLAVAFAVGAVPMAVLNHWLLAGLLPIDLEYEPPTEYIWCTILLVIWEIPLATAPITLFLGQALFTERPRAADVFSGFRQTLPQLLWYQVVLRGLLVPWVLTWFFLFASYPFLTEVIVLERNPLVGRAGRITTGRRSRNLHSGVVADLFARWLGTLVLGGVLFAAFFMAIFLVGGLLVSDWTLEIAPLAVYFHAALWLVVGYFAVVRFLCYLDLRIRREGWEVELLLRAEGIRLTRQLT